MPHSVPKLIRVVSVVPALLSRVGIG